jgi:periplasmic protein TonB
MSPTLVFPPPIRQRDLPPYGPSDWKRLQPVLLRQSLALSSGTALLAGLLLAVLVHQAAVLAPDQKNFVIVPPPTAPPLPGFRPPVESVPKTKIQTDGRVLAVKHEIPAIQDSVIPPPNPGLFDPNASTPIGTPLIPGNATVAKSEYPERPDPKAFVALDELPKETYAPKPEYPELARQANMEGTVMLNVLVNREGRVQEIILVRSSPMFDEAAEEAIRQWRFRPAIMGHETVAAWVHIPVRFVINGE